MKRYIFMFILITNLFSCDGSNKEETPSLKEIGFLVQEYEDLSFLLSINQTNLEAVILSKWVDVNWMKSADTIFVNNLVNKSNRIISFCDLLVSEIDYEIKLLCEGNMSSEENFNHINKTISNFNYFFLDLRIDYLKEVLIKELVYEEFALRPKEYLIQKRVAIYLISNSFLTHILMEINKTELDHNEYKELKICPSR